ncbi:MAG: urate hydroxylase PuuD [Alcaligenaceae bacterium]|nr:urate hydroxylase PuuD [Alcaligenaceae bacterium]
MEAYLVEFGNLLLRWLHVIAAIAWIGESIYFVMLDNSLRPPQAESTRKKGVLGEMWAVHGGGFYHNQKYQTAPAELPKDLHWSFWKSYTTWLSGFALFAIMYMSNPTFFLANPGSPWQWVRDLSGWQLNTVALVFLLGGWIVYDQLCRRISPNMERDGVLSIAVAIMMVVVAWLSIQIFQGRAAFLITGAVMATAMSANVFFWIIPGQRRMVNAMKKGDAPNPIDGKRGKQRSVHNTYFTLPVVFLMLSNHYSFTYTSEYAWIIMSLFIFSGALIRQYFVLMHMGQNKIAYPIAGIVLLVVIAVLAAPSVKPKSGATAANTAMGTQPPATNPENGVEVAPGTPLPPGNAMTRVQQIMNDRCIQCHAAKPTYPGFASAPAGIALETPADILANPALIKQVTANKYMPLGNVTKMTDEEREFIAIWTP